MLMRSRALRPSHMIASMYDNFAPTKSVLAVRHLVSLLVLSWSVLANLALWPTSVARSSHMGILVVLPAF